MTVEMSAPADLVAPLQEAMVVSIRDVAPGIEAAGSRLRLLTVEVEIDGKGRVMGAMDWLQRRLRGRRVRRPGPLALTACVQATFVQLVLAGALLAEVRDGRIVRSGRTLDAAAIVAAFLGVTVDARLTAHCECEYGLCRTATATIGTARGDRR